MLLTKSEQKEYYQKNKTRIKETYKRYALRKPWLKTLSNIRQRCGYAKDIKYGCYGGKGIKCFLTLSDLEFLWKRDGAESMLHPSIDRKDVKGDYSLDNCQFIEMTENRKKAIHKLFCS